MTDAAEPILSPRVGDVLAGKYRVERVIGRGGMGIVVAARHVHLGEKVAVKLLLPGSHVHPGAFERFVREGRAAARIRGEHVARVHDAGVLESGAPYLVLEHLDGVDLRTLLARRGKLSIDTAIVYVLQICEALAEAHAIGVIHRDLKPGNLFLTKRADGSDSIKVIDFGISKIVASSGAEGASLTDRDTAIGTPSYMAPEQMRSARDVDARADIWAIGAVTYGLVTGSSPFEGDTMIEVYDRILKGAPSIQDASPALDDIVRRCLRVDPSERFQDVGALAQALAEIAPPEGRLSADRAIRIARASQREAAPTLDAAPGLALGAAYEATEIEGAAPLDASTTSATKQPSWAPRTPSERSPKVAGTPSPSSDRAASTKWIVVGGVAMTIGAIASALSSRVPQASPSAQANAADRIVAAPTASASIAAPQITAPLIVASGAANAALPAVSSSQRPASPTAPRPSAAFVPRPTAVVAPRVPGFSETPD